ncbi:hypothetical protein [Paenibacillus flagellatus]|uniref:Methyltransferase type 11 domain-containing protein n=1 Tax=Paenibacillus flagellatus TaxID=2211139 RepID=A0A2V5KSQ6_9BACL|nr:hypothetical protein [Paenibacillus flagellatus]PYI52116.1 hypothetical protein DLM86_21790 [Paenibacillus flagellatus]
MGMTTLEKMNYFLFDRKPIAYNRINYNNCSERAVEIPIAVRFLLDSGAGTDAPYLEIGNVLSYYAPLLAPHPALANRQVLDKFEQCPGVLNVDLMDFATKYSRIVSLSTVEHVGQHAYGENKIGDREAPLFAIQKIYNLLEPGGLALITVPFGKLMDLGWLIQFGDDYLNSLVDRFGLPPEAVTLSYFKKLDMDMHFEAPRQVWIQCGPESLAETTFDSPYVFANGIAVIRLRKVSGDVDVRPQPAAHFRYHPPVAVGSLYAPPFIRPHGYDHDGWMPVDRAGYAFYGPYVPLAPQTYELRAYVEVLGHGHFTLNVSTQSGSRTLWSHSFSQTAQIEARIPVAAAAGDAEIRLYKHNDSPCRVRVPVLVLAPV